MSESSAALYAPSLAEVTTRALREEILAGHLAPGERLIEEQIRLRFSISRAPLREALRSLAQQGLVEHLPRRGTRVTELSDTDVTQLFGIRLVLEEHAIRLAFPVPGAPAATRLTEVNHWLDQMCQADRSGDHLRKDDAHRALHAAIVGLAGNHQLDLALDPVLLKLQRPMALNLRREALAAGPEEGIRRHEQLVAAVGTGDPDAIIAIMRRHGERHYL